jgi:hypothetical protein
MAFQPSKLMRNAIFNYFFSNFTRSEKKVSAASSGELAQLLSSDKFFQAPAQQKFSPAQLSKKKPKFTTLYI